MKLQGCRAFVGLLFMAGFLDSCGGPPDKSTAMRSIEKSAEATAGSGAPSSKESSGTATGATPAGKVAISPAKRAESLTYFNDKVLPLMKSVPCTNCHNAPRDLVDPNVSGGTGIQEHNTMFALLQDGKGPNNNKLINKLLGILPHGKDNKTGKLCATEDAEPCKSFKAWYIAIIGPGILSLGKVESINREGYIAGWAGSVDNPTTVYTIELYLDGAKGTGTALPTTMANVEAFDNQLTGGHAFSLKVPEAMIDGKAHKIYAYAINGSTSVELEGSPFSYQAYKPKTQAVGTQFANVGLNGCNGTCHNFGYADSWSRMLGNGMDGNWSATSNGFYDKLSGKVSHGGPALPGGTSINALSAWWTQEFGP